MPLLDSGTRPNTWTWSDASIPTPARSSNIRSLTRRIRRATSSWTTRAGLAARRGQSGCWVDLWFREFVLALDSNITVGGLGAGAFSLFEDEAQSAPQGLARRVLRGPVFEPLCEHRNRIRALPSKSSSEYRRRRDGRRGWGWHPSCVQLAVCSCYPFGDSQGCLFGCPNRIDDRRGAKAC
jgi:hypothetical protein